MAEPLAAIINESESKVFRRVFELPYIKSRFPFKKNVNHTNEKVKLWVDQGMKYSLVSDESFRHTIETCTLFCTYFHSFCGEDKFEYLVKLYVVIFILDDQTERHFGDGKQWDLKETKHIWEESILALKNIWDPIEAPIDLTSFLPYNSFWHSSIAMVCKDLNPVTKKRLLYWIQYYCEGNIEEAEALAEGTPHPFKSMEQLLKLRQKSAGNFTAFALCEYADDLIVTEEEFNDPVFQEFWFYSSEAIILNNDIVSFEKEWLDQNKDLSHMCNAVAVTTYLDGLSIPDAMEKIAKMYHKTEDKMEVCYKELISRQSISKDFRTYIDHITYVVGGNWKGGVTIDRYNKLYGDVIAEGAPEWTK